MSVTPIYIIPPTCTGWTYSKPTKTYTHYETPDILITSPTCALGPTHNLYVFNLPPADKYVTFNIFRATDEAFSGSVNLRKLQNTVTVYRRVIQGSCLTHA